MSDLPLRDREVILEYFPVPPYMRVTAMDTATLTEISIQGPVNAARPVLERNALKRLEYVLKKKGLI
ncbi:MAG: hypothetical protein H6868_08030 [Rhodospirillales bacterium]|nr:hypothetical protein [Rhodospirillales bacterium]